MGKKIIISVKRQFVEGRNIDPGRDQIGNSLVVAVVTCTKYRLVAFRASTVGHPHYDWLLSSLA